MYKPQAMEARERYPNNWRADLMHAPLQDLPCESNSGGRCLALFIPVLLFAFTRQAEVSSHLCTNGHRFDCACTVFRHTGNIPLHLILVQFAARLCSGEYESARCLTAQF